MTTTHEFSTRCNVRKACLFDLSIFFAILYFSYFIEDIGLRKTNASSRKKAAVRCWESEEK